MRSARSLVLLAVSVIALAGCFTGKRGHFAEATAPVQDPAVAAVLAKLETPTPAPFTATYNLFTKFGVVATLGTVAKSTPTSASVTIGDVRYITDDTGEQTCVLSTGACTPGLDDAKVSNLSLTHNFPATSPAARLRQDATVMVGPAVPSTRDIAGQTATCVQVGFAAGSKVYCALDNGLLAYQDTPDLEITLLSYAAGADPSLFSTQTTVAG